MKDFILLIILLGLILYISISAVLPVDSHGYQVPTAKEIEANRWETEDLIYPGRLKMGLSRYREPLPLQKDYINNPKAQKELYEIYKKLSWDWTHNTDNNWNTSENIRILINFIKKYRNSSQAVTAKLLLAQVVGEAFHTDTLPSLYWSLDLLREVYEDFPDKWQGKVALFVLYKRIFFPALHCEPGWIYQFLDDFETITKELENLHFQSDKYHEIKEYEKYRFNLINWYYVFDAYCMMSKSRTMNERGLSEIYRKNAQSIYAHMWDLCKRGKYCEFHISQMESEIHGKRMGDTHYGPCIPDNLPESPEPKNEYSSPKTP